MQIKTNNGESYDVASNGKANAGLTLGIIGTGLAALGGGLNGLFGGVNDSETVSRNAPHQTPVLVGLFR